ncbi:MAG: YkgJ family cysteine cluster protein [Thermodesulfobacteriota bacterium]
MSMLLSSFLEDLGRQILRIYAQIDRKVATFQMTTGIKCPPGCGQCCASAKVKVTPLEFIPLAQHLFQRGETDAWWPYLIENQEGTCIFYQEDLPKFKNGHCRVYPWRAATCRLYGFGVKQNKYGTLEPITCHFLKNDFYKAIEHLGRNNAEALCPSYDSFMIQIAALDQNLGRIPLPVNQAIAKALEKYALAWQINSSLDYFSTPESVLAIDRPDLKERNIKGISGSEN